MPKCFVSSDVFWAYLMVLLDFVGQFHDEVAGFAEPALCSVIAFGRMEMYDHVPGFPYGFELYGHLGGKLLSNLDAHQLS